ncbi:hypothetical protein OSB04_031263 [Centaurea solstitialis]|uniref:tRNA(Ile)-lysidine synthetase n=1 Tax=Centaurea solstitialis TaxID=347529 RepID=A0AA38S961_9ASTR|nr:hypothetical protein OSB04_031263 [Centaurea solstitialis]
MNEEWLEDYFFSHITHHKSHLIPTNFTKFPKIFFPTSTNNHLFDYSLLVHPHLMNSKTTKILSQIAWPWLASNPIIPLQRKRGDVYRVSAVGVSGGPDSMALCLLVAEWKSCGLNVASMGNNDMVDGLLAIIVDHGLRAESKDEAEMVQRRVLDMGIRCEIAHCNWRDGKPKLGHLQEAARDIRYEKLQDICSRHKIGVLLIAHHADDQAELFILRLSRNSGVLGLAGMALATQLFATTRCFDDGTSNSILLVRPLLDFSKQDLYKICEAGKQKWVEDPTNQNTIFTRNRIRMSLGNLSSSIFKSELQAIISACRRTRVYLDQVCHTLINQAVTVMPQGYVIVDLGNLNPSEVPDICLSKFLTLLLQFISQRQRPVRGSAQKLLLDYFRTFPCKSSFTAAGCYLCPAPSSKGTKILICCSVDSALPTNTKSFHIISPNNQKVNTITELHHIIEDGRSYSNKTIPNASDIHFLNTNSSESILTEAKRLKILGEPTLLSIRSLHEVELEKFKLKAETLTNHVQERVVESLDVKELGQGQIGYFMDRFVVLWEFVGENDGCCNCGFGRDSVVEVRHMVDADWVDLSRLSKGDDVEDFEKVFECSDYAKISAQKGLRLLKCIPVAARRSLPVLVNPRGEVLSIPVSDLIDLKSICVIIF